MDVSRQDAHGRGEAGDYVFVAAKDYTIGATIKQSDKQPKGWTFYFRVLGRP